ncbi:MAG: DUF2017 domain-containing protein [Streptosporangiaceae bacterium]
MTWDPLPGDDAGPDAKSGEQGLAASFRAAPGGAVAFFEQPQAGVIRSLVGQVAELVSADAEAGGEASGEAGNIEAELGLSSHAQAPDDPVLARLLPDAYSGDAEAAAEFRRYTEETLRSGKVASAQIVLASLPPGGGEVRLTEPECQQWLRALNDVRLALSVRLGITDEDDDLTEQFAVDDPRSAYVWVYQWLAYLQDSLLDALT